MIVGAFAASRWSKIRSAIGVSALVSGRTPEPGEPRFLKGQTHAHTNNSGDSQTPPDEAGRWYAEHGFDFVVFTDHNFVTSIPSSKDTLLFPGVELTQNLERCDDPPPSEGRSCLLHVNALFVDPKKAAPLPAATSTRRADLFARALKATAAMNGLAQINHPNFQYAADARVLTELARQGAVFLEIANEAFDSNNGGDATHPSTEALWDAVLSEGLTVYGVASDDAHHYADAATAAPAYVGNLGFVMVRARKDVTSIREAMARGDFYSSTGVLFTRLEQTDDALVLQTDADVTFQCIGEQGRVLSKSVGRQARCDVPPTSYVRAVAEDAAGKKAWSQPLRRKILTP